jgi:release factor glutamine methyltransferase
MSTLESVVADATPGRATRRCAAPSRESAGNQPAHLVGNGAAGTTGALPSDGSVAGTSAGAGNGAMARDGSGAGNGAGAGNRALAGHRAGAGNTAGAGNRAEAGHSAGAGDGAGADQTLLRRPAAFQDSPLADARTARRESFVRRAWRAGLRVKLALVDRRKYHSVQLEHVDGMPIVVLPDVFNPRLLRSGDFLVQQLVRPDLLPSGSRVLDLGSGSGACGIAAARRGCHVTAVDINPDAVRCTTINALLNAVAVDVREGDLFGPVDGERFDVVLFNPPYYRGIPRDAIDHAWRSPDIVERFASTLASHLSPGGHALVVLSSDGEQASFLAALQAAGFRSRVAAQRDLINETLSVYHICPC